MVYKLPDISHFSYVSHFQHNTYPLLLFIRSFIHLYLDLLIIASFHHTHHYQASPHTTLALADPASS